MFIVPTESQRQQMCKPWSFSTAVLITADFLGRQDYIDWWIKRWLKKDVLGELPLCVSESIHCDKKLREYYLQKLFLNINNLSYLQTHYIVSDPDIWNVVDFNTVPVSIFRFLNVSTPIPERLCSFVVAAQNLDMLKVFVESHGPSLPLCDAICQQWFDGVRWLLSEGAEIDGNCVGLSVRHSSIFREVTMYNPPAKKCDWEEFLLQKLLGRVPDVHLVEEWFWINGFKMTPRQSS